MSTKTLTIIYWISTVLIVLNMGFFAFGQIVQSNPKFIEEMALFGFPLPFIKALGFSKIFGIVALLVPGFPRIREWAYAGFAFTLLGAAFAHIAAGMYITPHWVMLAVLFVSYFLWHKLDSPLHLNKTK